MNKTFEIEKLFGTIMPFGADNEPDANTDTGNADTGNADTGNADTGAGNKDEDKSKSKDNDKSKDDEDEDDPYKGLTPNELKRVLKDEAQKRKDAEADAQTHKDKIEAEERKTRSKEDNLEKDLQSERDTSATLRKTIAQLSITNEILNNKDYKWKDVNVVIQQLNSETVKVDDDGKVVGLTKELKRISTEFDWMLDKETTTQNGPTGFQPGQGGSNGEPNKAALAQHYPALASRG